MCLILYLWCYLVWPCTPTISCKPELGNSESWWNSSSYLGWDHFLNETVRHPVPDHPFCSLILLISLLLQSFPLVSFLPLLSDFVILEGRAWKRYHCLPIVKYSRTFWQAFNKELMLLLEQGVEIVRNQNKLQISSRRGPCFPCGPQQCVSGSEACDITEVNFQNLSVV